jgi:hypothetical protein
VEQLIGEVENDLNPATPESAGKLQQQKERVRPVP